MKHVRELTDQDLRVALERNATKIAEVTMALLELREHVETAPVLLESAIIQRIDAILLGGAQS
ncbi:hypothetical protein [Pseudaminobacter soli (ex Li et al. 2025)]|uniref:Uncharacterized protein n=1 Tax=Pseudaminobacter soli (ex Li et al. 2025) TaxID=1295366 RepID=A0A2P7SEN4_9HYPH|nr:hypothetical protein [Mesorhizobium soli]PSJ60771.1 hypothetical protein C7I85_12065 [Mesorhizobium soli]